MIKEENKKKDAASKTMINIESLKVRRALLLGNNQKAGKWIQE